MEVLVKLVAFIQQMGKKEFERYLGITLGSVIVLTGIIIYSIHCKSEDLIDRMKRTDIFAQKISTILTTYEKMKTEEDKYQNMIEKHKDFTLNGTFEQLCREQNITPEPGWVSRTDSINEKFDEISLPATFKGLTTEKLVNFLDALDKKELIYVKEVKIKNTGSKQISCEITIATNKYKASFE
ncbi:MAG: hypothetical protein WCT20_04065 [Candidatus Babeliales bacterium]